MRYINLGTEAIDFQTSHFADNLANLLEDIFSNYRSGKAADESKEAKQLNAVIKKNTGLNISVEFDNEYPPCVMPFVFNPNSVLTSKALSEYYANDTNGMLKKLEKQKEGTIDLKNGKVTGFFTEFNIPIYMGFHSVKSLYLTPKEKAAVLMHEIGHAFVALEMAFNTVQTNQILLCLHKASINNNQKEFHYTLNKIDGLLNQNSTLETELKEEKDFKVISTVTTARIIEKRKSELGTSAYDFSTFEALADNYAVRMGLGRDLVTGLERIYKRYGIPEYSKINRVILYLLEIISILSIGISILTGSIVATIIGVFHAILSVYTNSITYSENHRYDTPKVRFKRIKEQIIQQLKDPRLKTLDSRRILKDLEIIEKSLNEVGEHTTIFRLISYVFMPQGFILKSRMATQRKLEELSANELYIKAAELRSI